MLAGAIRCDKMRKELWGRSADVSLNIILLCSVEFILVRLFSCVFVISISRFGSFYLCNEKKIGRLIGQIGFVVYIYSGV